MCIPHKCHINVKFRTSEKVTVTLLIPQFKKKKIVYFVLKSFIFLKKKKKGKTKPKKEQTETTKLATATSQ